MAGYFLKIEDDIAENPDLSWTAKGVYGAIANFARRKKSDGNCYASHTTIGKRTGLGRRAVLNAVKVLIGVGLIVEVAEGRRNGQAKTYCLTSENA